MFYYLEFVVMSIEESWEKIGQIAGLLSLGNGVVTVTAPVPSAEVNGVMTYGVRFSGDIGKSTISFEALAERDSEAWARYLGAKLWG
jgi:hypothetical protein